MIAIQKMESVERPWGYYTNVFGTDHSSYKVKLICVKPGARLSLQSHYKRSEHWVVVQGIARVTVGSDQIVLYKNQHAFIPKEVHHRLQNIGDEELKVIETQIGDYLGEDDIVRYQDDYSRTEEKSTEL